MGVPQSGREPRFTTSRRFLVLFAFALWQGGFLFYALVVVPVGTDVLGSAAAQSEITQKVTNWLNLIGAGTLAIFALDQSLTRDSSPRRTAARWWIWSLLLVGQYLLFFLHEILDYYIEVGGMRRPMYLVHRIYLWISTILWSMSLLLIGLNLKAWTAEDRKGK